MNKTLEQQYGYLWHRPSDGWVLIRDPELQGGYSVINKLNFSVLLIECEEENKAVCERMKDAGCEVLEDFPSPIRDVIAVPAELSTRSRVLP